MGYRENWFKANANPLNVYRCNCCGKFFKKTEIDIDHIVPKNQGGTDELWNLQALCKHCNRSKQDNMNNTPKDLTINVAKNIIKGNNINNVDDMLSNIAKKQIKKFFQ